MFPFLRKSRRYRPANDGKYVHDDDKYVHTKDQFGGFGASGRSDGGIVIIGGGRVRTTATPSKPLTTKSAASPPLPSPTPLPSPSPPIFVIDNNRNIAAVNRNQNDDNDSSLTKDGIKIIRQEQDASENGYRYL